MQYAPEKIKDVLKDSQELQMLLTALSKRQRNTGYLDVKRFTYLSRLPRDKVLKGLEDLQSLGAGTLVKGPGGRTRGFKWNVPALALVQDAGLKTHSKAPSKPVRRFTPATRNLRLALPSGAILEVSDSIPDDELGRLMKVVNGLS